jgi:hypothetical protein
MPGDEDHPVYIFICSDRMLYKSTSSFKNSFAPSGPVIFSNASSPSTVT